MRGIVSARSFDPCDPAARSNNGVTRFHSLEYWGRKSSRREVGLVQLLSVVQNTIYQSICNVRSTEFHFNSSKSMCLEKTSDQIYLILPTSFVFVDLYYLHSAPFNTHSFQSRFHRLKGGESRQIYLDDSVPPSTGYNKDHRTKILPLSTQEVTTSSHFSPSVLFCTLRKHPGST